MKHSLLISVLSLLIYNGTHAAWVQKTSLQASPRSYANSFVINGKAYVGGGFDSNFQYLDDYWEYDPGTDSWTQKATLQNTISGASCFTISGKGYLVNGWINGTNSNDVYEYDAVNNTWTLKNPFPGGGRYLSCSFEINNIGYIGLGDSPLFNDFWAYDPTIDTWTQKTSFTGSAREATFSFAINGIGYVGSGTDQVSFAGLNDFWSYNPGTDAWTQLGNFSGPARHSAVSFVCSGKAYVGTGIDGNVGGAFYNDFYEYDPGNLTWTLIDSFPGNIRGAASAFTIGNCGYVFGGYYFPSTGTFYNDLWSYCLTTDINENDARSIDVKYNAIGNLIRVDCGNYALQNGVITIYDMQGKCVLSSEIHGAHFEIPFEKHAVGIYSYRINAEERFIKSGRLNR